MDKEDVYAYTHREWTPLRHLKNEIMPLAAAWMDLEINILMEGDRKRKTIFMWYHPYVESKRNISMKQEQTHRHREQACGCQGGKDWELGISRQNLFIHRMDKEWGPTVWHREFYSVSCHNHNGKEYTCRVESVCCTAEMSYTSIMFLIFKICGTYTQWSITQPLKRIHLNQFWWDGWNWSRLHRVK